MGLLCLVLVLCFITLCPFSLAIILMGKREVVAFLQLSNMFKPSSKNKLLTVPKQYFFSGSFLGHLSRRLKVRYCDYSSSSVRCASVVRKLFFNQHLLLNHWTNFIKLHLNVPHDAFFQYCINGLTPLNRRAARAPDKKSFKQHLLLNIWSKF